MNNEIEKSLSFAIVEKLWVLGLLSEEELSRIKSTIETNLQNRIA